MKKRQLDELITASYAKGELNEKQVSAIASHLDKKNLKSYIRGLKLEEKKKKVIVALPHASLYNTSKKIFIDLFPNGVVSVEEDALLLLGGRVTFGDMVYDFSLKKRLENFLNELDETYEY